MDRNDVFATLDAKLVLREGWRAQSLHRHRPLELIAALDGPIELRTAANEGHRASCFLVPPMRQHALATYAGRVVRIYFDPGYHHLVTWRQEPIRSDLPDEDVLLTRIASFFASRRSPERARELIGDWLDSWIDSPARSVPCDPRVAAALLYLDQQTTSPQADRRSIAARVELSPTRFAALFAENTGMSLSRYLIWRRVKIALSLICAGETITGAALQAGFADGAHLTRSCRQTYGCTPSSIVGLKVSRTAFLRAGKAPERETNLCLAPQRKTGLRERRPA